MMNPVITFLIFFASVFISFQLTTAIGDPILIVPGITGSRLSVKRSGFSTCNTRGRTRPLWVNEGRIIFRFHCARPEMMLNFDRRTGQYSSTSDDITVSVPGFGSTETVETMSRGLVLQFPYFKEFVDYFVKRGYKRGKSIRAAPYDWRVGPEELQKMGYYRDLKGLIEIMYAENGNRKVSIVAHSMGAPLMLHFLTESGVVNQAWKNQFIGNFIPVAGAWSGGNKALQFQISGLTAINRGPGDIFNFFFRLQDRITDPLTPILRSFQSIHFVLPRPNVWGNTVLVTTPTQSYTTNDYQQLFQDLQLEDTFAMYQGISNLIQNFPSPNVPTHCLYGVGVDTPMSFHYTRPFPEGAEDDPEVTNGDGDGTVNFLSSEVCLRWANNNGGQPFRSKTFQGTEHVTIIEERALLREIESIVGASRR